MKKRIALFLTCCFAAVSMATAQVSTATGTVTAADDGEPLVGAQVQVQGTEIRTITDANGKFTLRNIPAGSKKLVISCIGMAEQVVNIRSNNAIALRADNKQLDEVIKVAYGTATRATFTGSAGVVGAEQIENQIATNVTSALVGANAGVQYVTSSGDPTGNAPTIRIRGIGSINASNSPLYVVDGVPYDGSISSINPQDVESITVLKDASASAIYGARGANGVILINTKRGKKGTKTDVKFDAKWGSNSRMVPNYDIITEPGSYYEQIFARLYNTNITSGYDADYSYQNANTRMYDRQNGGVGYQVFTVPEGQYLIGTNGKLNPNATLGYTDGQYYYTPDDWYDEAFHNSFRQEYNFSVSGTADRISAYVSGGYLNDGGIINNSGFKRYTGRTNIDYRATDWMDVHASMSYTHGDSETNLYSGEWGSSGNLFFIANNIAPIYPLYVRDATGQIMTDGGRIVYDANQTNFSRAGTVGNAVRDNEYNAYKSYRDAFNGNWGITITPIKGLSISGNLGVMSNNARSNYLSSVFGGSSASDGYTSVSHGRTFTVNSQLLAEYKTDFGGSDHNLGILVGYEQYKYKYQSLSGSNTHLYDPYIGELSNALSTADKDLSSSTTNFMTEGVLSRLQYDYAGKYFLSASYRRDASSRFAPGHRWGNFGSVGAAWLINREKFMSNVKWIDLLKFKASFGVQGNDGLGNSYVYSDMYSTSYNETTGEYSNSLVQKGNDELTWETSYATNVGFDFEMFRKRFSGSIEYFTRKTTDMLFYKDFPLSAGYGTSIQLPINVGSVMNHGIEVELEGVAVSTRDFEWRLNANLTHYKNKILRLQDEYREEGIKYSNAILKEGGSVYQTYMYKFAGLDEEGSALYYKETTDEEGNTVLTTTTNATDATRFDCGTTLPKVYGGFGTSLRYKGIDLVASFTYQLGGQIYDAQYQNLMWTQDQTGQALHRDIYKAWTVNNTNTNVPRFDATGWGNLSQSVCDYFLTNSNYLSLNNVQLGYTLPKDVLNKLHLTNLRIYVAGENLALWSCRKGLDPRNTFATGSFNSAYGSSNYSIMRTITAGITLNF